MAGVGTFNRKLHVVAGEAAVINDCTIQVDMFNYDGLGITAQLYAIHRGQGWLVLSEALSRALVDCVALEALEPAIIR